MKIMRYLCKHCKNTINIKGKSLYDFCPVCGSRGTLYRRSKGRETALENAERVRSLIPDLERTRAEYLKYYNEYQKLQRALQVSKCFGNISKDEIPKFQPELTNNGKISKQSRNKKKS